MRIGHRRIGLAGGLPLPAEQSSNLTSNIDGKVTLWCSDVSRVSAVIVARQKSDVAASFPKVVTNSSAFLWSEGFRNSLTTFRSYFNQLFEWTVFPTRLDSQFVRNNTRSSPKRYHSATVFLMNSLVVLRLLYIPDLIFTGFVSRELRVFQRALGFK